MIRVNNEQKDKINVLLNVDNFYGKFTGGIGRILLFIALACVPFLIYTLLLVQLIPFTWFIVVYIPYCIQVALITIGRQKERMEAYLKQRNDEYASAKELIRIADVHQDGLIEYQNGTICYIIQAYGFSYFEDNQFSKDIEEFLFKLTSQYEVDIYGHVVTGESGTSQEDLEKLRVYVDSDFMKERLEFYKYQDKFTNDNTKLYRLNFVVKSYKNQWAKLKKDLTALVSSESMHCFDMPKVCDKDQVIDVISRDTTLYVDLAEMLRTKHSSDNYFGSRVLYFGEEVPEDMKEQKDTFETEEGRRVIDDN
jgi:hypothetical protein